MPPLQDTWTYDAVSAHCFEATWGVGSVSTPSPGAQWKSLICVFVSGIDPLKQCKSDPKQTYWSALGSFPEEFLISHKMWLLWMTFPDRSAQLQCNGHSCNVQPWPKLFYHRYIAWSRWASFLEMQEESLKKESITERNASKVDKRCSQESRVCTKTTNNPVQKGKKGMTEKEPIKYEHRKSSERAVYIF